MSLNIANVETVIAKLEKLPPEQFQMTEWFSRPGRPDSNLRRLHSNRISRAVVMHTCGTAACIAGWTNIARGAPVWYGARFEAEWLGLNSKQAAALFKPSGFEIPSRYPLSRALRTLNLLRSEYLRTGKVVIDWNAPEPASSADAGQALPESLTIPSLLRQPVEACDG